jgi:peptide/nickel transport system substrate-binding protein
MSGLNQVPKQLSPSEYVKTELPLAAATMVFFKTSEGLLSASAVRNALVGASDPTDVIATLGYNTRPVRAPLLVGQLGYDKRYAQKTGDAAAAARALDAAGWLTGGGGVREKDGKKLQFALTYADTPEYRSVANTLEMQWRAVGVRMIKQPLDGTSFKSSLVNHDYEAVLYGITIGPDPDVFVYWDSSQADILAATQLNLSEYKSKVVDDARDAGRTRDDPALRVVKYRPFLAQWQKDAPAVGLYQPRYLYLSRTQVYNMTDGEINTPTDRLNNVADWMIRTARVTNE